MKSAVLARCSGATRVIGFPSAHLRERAASWFYSEQPEIGEGLARHRPAAGPPLRRRDLARTQALSASNRVDAGGRLRHATGGGSSVRPPDSGRRLAEQGVGPRSFRRSASAMASRWGWTPIVSWGPKERALAEEVVHASNGTACLAPPTTSPTSRRWHVRRPSSSEATRDRCISPKPQADGSSACSDRPIRPGTDPPFPVRLRLPL